MQEEDLGAMFVLPLSIQVHEEMQHLQSHLEAMPYDDSCPDIDLGANYYSKRLYAHAFSGVEAHPFFKKVWKSHCTPRVKFFACLILMDQLNTKTMLRRRNLNIHDDTLYCWGR